MKTEVENKLVEVFCGKIWEAEMFKGFLESAGVQVFLQNEIVGSIYPAAVSPAGLTPVKVMVPDLDLDIAKELIEEYKKDRL